MRITIWQFIPRPPRIPLSRLELQFFPMFFPHTLQYPKIVQKVQDRGDRRTRRRSAHCDLGSDGELASVLRVDVDERGDQPSY